jgi:hypothetical protein
MTGYRAAVAGASPGSARDAALRRIGRTRRWLLVATAALTAALAALASALLPGKSLGPKSHIATTAPARAASVPATVTPQLPAPATGAQLGLGDPSGTSSGQAAQSAPSSPPVSQTAPQPAPQTAAAASGGGGVVVSGGS